jgi:hypothetical protein
MNLYEMFEQELPPEPTIIDALRDFLPIAVKHLELDHIPKIHLAKEISDTHVPTFGRFENESKTITVVVDNRNIVDVLRTLAHEMVHYRQGEEHRLDADSWHTGSPIEDEANAEGGVIMRLFNQAHPNYMKIEPVVLPEEWSQKYKKSINCSNPKGFSQKAHCAGRKKKANENFADGKKPGRKGLAKRSGVDCSQSISKLRSIAKSSSGERQRMAHWCANMKSGKKK